ncbi:MAG: hypothetical protein KKF98_10750 [Bacteroidetes bacterium]|nr:hypothetical protein [Bacteroidota bacterium]
MRNNLTVLITICLLCSCGTAPWFINKKEFQTYKEDIYTFSNIPIRTNGYYLQVGDLHPRVSYRDAIIFFENGYTTSFWLLERNFKSEIITKITCRKDTLWTDLDWWKVQYDSLIIEHYGENGIDIVTSNYFERGKILNDTLIELKFDDSPYPPVKFRFIETDSLPIVKNKGRYLKKDWYNNKLNENRKTTANK